MNFNRANDHGISTRDLEILESVLSRYEEHLTKVALFGSRATGRFKPHSDIDLVLFGGLVRVDLLRINTELQESSISLRVDVCIYALADEGLRRHIDSVCKPMYTASANA